MTPDKPMRAGNLDHATRASEDNLQNAQEAAFETARDAGMFDAENSLCDCCAAAIDYQPNTILTSNEMLARTMRGFDDIFGDGKQERKFAQVNGGKDYMGQWR